MAIKKKGRIASKVSNTSLDEHVTEQAHGLAVTESTLTGKKEVAPWEVNKVEAESDVRLEEDTGSGRATIVRQYVFKLPPGLPQTPSKEELLDHHLHRIKAQLWRDELDLVLDPRIIMGKQGKFTIFATCQPRMGSFIHERPQTLSQIANGT